MTDRPWDRGDGDRNARSRDRPGRRRRSRDRGRRSRGGDRYYRSSARCVVRRRVEKPRTLARPITVKRPDLIARRLRDGLTAIREQSDIAAEARQYGYGIVELPTVRVFREIDTQGRIHQVHVIQADELDGVLAYIIEAGSDSIAFVYPGDDPGQLESDGTIRSGRFSGVESQIRLFDGTQNQADADLVAQTSVDSQFIGRGIAYVWSRFTFQDGRFSGDPNVRVIARSRKIVDPVDAAADPLLTFETLPKTFSLNPYRFIFDYLIRPVDRGGAGLPLSQVNVASFVDSSVWSEGLVDAIGFTRTAVLAARTNDNVGTPPINTNHLLEFNEAVAPFQYGDVVQVFANPGQTLPPNLTDSTEYHVIPVRHAVGDDLFPAIALAESFENALLGISIPQGNRVSGIQVVKTKEIRYQSGVTYRAGEAILQNMLESCGAFLYFDNGQIAISDQRFPDEADIVRVPLEDLIGPIALSLRDEPDERVNELSGIFTSLTNLFVPSTYPAVNGAGVFKAEDNGQRLPGDLNLPFVAKASVAQRLATVELRRRRQELTVAFSGDLELFRLKPNTIFSLDFPKYSLDDETTFEVRDQTFFISVEEGSPSLGINIEARQLEDATFNLDLTNEQFVDTVDIPGLSDPFNVLPPGLPTITEELFQTRRGGGIKAQVNLEWAASNDPFVTRYLVSYKVTTNIDFIFLAETPDTRVSVLDIEPGFYDFRVQAINSLGLRSDPTDAQILNRQVLGLAARPAAPQNVLGQVISSSSIILSWDRSTDLDVVEGGFVQIRHDPAILNAIARDSTVLVQDVGGQTSLLVPFKQGTYFVRFEDSTGQFSDTSIWSTQDRRPVSVAQDINLVDIGGGGFTLQEDPGFPSSDPENTLIFVTDHLELPLQDTIDDEADFDAIPDVDQVGGGDVVPDGLYFFNTDVELVAITRVVFETVLATEVFDLSNSIDDEDDFDNIQDVDSVAAALQEPGAANAEVQVRFSNGTVASDTFGPWERIDTGIFEARSFQFRVFAQSFRPSTNIRITQARVRMRADPL